MKAKIRKDIQNIAKNYDLKYRKDIFNAIIIPKKEVFILNYITMCPMPEYNKFGKTLREREKKFDMFLDFQTEQCQQMISCIKILIKNESRSRMCRQQFGMSFLIIDH